MLAPSERPLPSFMLFKTLSAAVFGIDAYVVEVEVDVGSARMNDFNVVGLPDNAVKESRERIKSALRNCGIEFPYGQGVTINLAPADVKKEGSAFDLPMALGLAGCMGQFFGKPNPCPCGYFGDPTRECHCTPPMIQRYVAKISGPLLHRIAIHIDLPAG